MSSLIDSGYQAKEAERVRQQQCPKAADGKHDWKQFGSWPSTWGECKRCGATYFDK